LHLNFKTVTRIDYRTFLRTGSVHDLGQLAISYRSRCEFFNSMTKQQSNVN